MATAGSEKRIIGWIEDMIDEPLSSSTDLCGALKDGIALCKLVNRIREGSVPYINTNPGVLNHLENISAYLQACWTLGVPTDAIFGTQDLQKRNVEAVIKNLDALATVTVSNDSSIGPSSLPPTQSRTEVSSEGSPASTKTSQIDPSDDLVAENEELMEENQSLRKRLRKIQETVEELEANIADKDKEICDLTEKLATTTEELLQAKEKVEAAVGNKDPVELKARRLSRLESEIMLRGRTNADLNLKVHQLEEANAKLQRELSLLRESSTTSLDMSGTITQDDGYESSRSSSRTSLPDTGAATTVPKLDPRERWNSTGSNGSSTSRRRRSNAFTRGPDGSLYENENSTPRRRGHEREDSNSSDPGTSTTTANHRHDSSASGSGSAPSTPFQTRLEHSESTPISPRRSRGPNSPEGVPLTSVPSSDKRKGLASRIKNKIGALRSTKGDKTEQGGDLTGLVKTIVNNTSSAVTFQDVVKVSFKKDTSRRLFSLILDQQMNSFTLQKSHGLTPHSFDMLLYLVNASLLAMADDTDTDTIALQVLMRSAFFFFKKERGTVQYMHEHIRSHDIWKRFEFWEEYFYSEVGHHAKNRKDDPKLVFSVLSEFVSRMKDFSVAGGLVQKLINDVAGKDLLTKEEVEVLKGQSNPSQPPTPTASTGSTETIPVMVRHVFSQKSTKKPAWCDFCNEFIWGVAKIVFSCTDCKYTIHRKCLDECLPHTACSAKKTVGTPFAVSHNVKVTKNAAGGYEGLPKEWQELLEQAGIDQQDVLANPHAVLHIMEYHQQQRKRGDHKIMPTPAGFRQNKEMISPPLPEPTTPREGEGEGQSDTAGPTASLPMETDADDAEPSQYTIDDVVTREDPNTLYRDITQIGQGANAQVFSGYSIKTGAKVAIKRLRWEANKSHALVNEIQIMKTANHDNVVRCSDCFLFNDEIWVIMEFVDFGSLTDILEQYPRGLQMTEAEIAFVSVQTLKALDHVHAQGIIHRDVKTDNILLGVNGKVLLADFGSAARLTPSRPNRKTVIGSPYWMAPELIRGEEYSQKVDIFSFGCTLQELAVGEPPFSEYPPLKTLFLLATADVPPLKNEDKRWTPLFMDFCNKCVRKDPATRPSASDLLMHPFLGMACKQEEFTGVIQKALSYRDSVMNVFGLGS